MSARLRLTPVDPLESVRQKDVVAALKRHPAIAAVHRINVGKFNFMQYGIVGHCDLLIWLKPRYGTRMGFVECKRATTKPSMDQLDFMWEMNCRGHIVFVARNGADAWAEFERQLAEKKQIMTCA